MSSEGSSSFHPTRRKSTASHFLLVDVFPFPPRKKAFLLLFHSWAEQWVPQEVLEVREGGRRRQEQEGLAKVTQQGVSRARSSLDVTPASSRTEHQHRNVMLLLPRWFLRSLPAADEVRAVSVQRHFTVVTLEQNNSSVHLSKCLRFPFQDR